MRFMQPTEEQERGLADWVAERPPAVRAVAERFNPWTLYRMKSTGQRVTVVSFGEPDHGGAVTLKVLVSGEFNVVIFDREVFGIKPEDLEECDLPQPGELLGTALTNEEAIDRFVDAARPFVLRDRAERIARGEA